MSDTTDYCCPDCGESSQFCRMTPMAEGGTCCADCKARGYHTLEPYELRSADSPGSGEPMSPAEEDRITIALLRLAAEPGQSAEPEQFGRASLNAYRALAESRGVDLERVVRAACQDNLRAIVELPVKAREAS